MRSGVRISAAELGLLAAAAANLVCVEVWPRWESQPLHLSFVVLTLGYCAAGWAPWHRVALLAFPVLGAMTALWLAERQGMGVEGIEVALLTTLAVATVWRAESRRRARRRLTGLSHDLLTAMTIIRGHVELLGRRPASTAEIDGVREVVIDEIDRLTDRLDGRGGNRAG